MIYITGDLHGEIDIKRLGGNAWPIGKELSKQDFLVVAGDFGLVWANAKEELYWRNWLNDRNWTTLFIDGNHENFDLLEQFPVEEKFGGKVARITDSIFWLKRGEVFTLEDKKIFTFGGGMSHDREYRTPGKSWWPQEQSNQSDFDNAINNLEKHEWNVDCVVSHVPPFCEILGFMPRAQSLKGYGCDWAEHHLDEIKRRLNFKKWYFGHLHLDQTISRFCALYYKIVELGA